MTFTLNWVESYSQHRMGLQVRLLYGQFQYQVLREADGRDLPDELQKGAAQGLQSEELLELRAEDDGGAALRGAAAARSLATAQVGRHRRGPGGAGAGRAHVRLLGDPCSGERRREATFPSEPRGPRRRRWRWRQRTVGDRWKRKGKGTCSEHRFRRAHGRQGSSIPAVFLCARGDSGSRTAGVQENRHLRPALTARPGEQHMHQTSKTTGVAYG